MIARHLLPCAMGLGALAAIGCRFDSGSQGDGVPPVLGTTDSTTGSETTSTSAIDETGDPGPPTGPRKRRLDLDPQFTAEATSGVTLLVVLDSTRIEYGDTMAGGADLRFFGPEEGAAYPIEIEHWDPSGRSFVWVFVDAPPDHLWMYYGDGEGFATADSGLVWDEDFAAVWHMVRGNDSRMSDSTANGYDLQPFNFNEQMLDIEGRIGLAVELAPPPAPTELGPLDLTDAGQLSLTDALTIEAWVSPTIGMDSATHVVLRKGESYELRTREPMSTRPTLAIRTEGGGGQVEVEAGSSVPIDDWTYVAATYDASSGRMNIYRNGMPEGMLVVDGDPMQRALVTSPDAAKIGRGMQALLDEVRVSSIARSPAWIALQYASMSDTLFTFGSPQARD